jgi:hypothetical protein
MYSSRFIDYSEIGIDTEIVDFGYNVERGCVVLFEDDTCVGDSNNKWVGIFEKGVTDYKKCEFYLDDTFLIIANGKGYICGCKNKIHSQLGSYYYTDSIINAQNILLSSFTDIDIYSQYKLVKSIQIDDIDGIRFLEKNNDFIRGEFRQISSTDFNEWLPFYIDMNTIEFNCDKNRMWIETSFIDGKTECKYLTMDLKQKQTT